MFSLARTELQFLFRFRASHLKLPAGKKIKQQANEVVRELIYKHDQKSLLLNVYENHVPIPSAKKETVKW